VEFIKTESSKPLLLLTWARFKSVDFVAINSDYVRLSRKPLAAGLQGGQVISSPKLPELLLDVGDPLPTCQVR